MKRLFCILLFTAPAFICRAQTCDNQVVNMRNSFEQQKSQCAQANLSYNYVGQLEPRYADNVPDCVSLGKACIPKVQAYDAQAAVCDATAKQSTEKNATNNLTGYSNDVISAMNDASSCVSSAIDDAYQPLHSAELACMSAQEGIYRANDQCDVNMTNLSIKAQRLQCASQNPNEIASFKAQKSALVSDIANYANQMNAWGKKVAANVMSNYHSCSGLFTTQVAKKNAAIKNYMSLSGQAFRVKRTLSSN